MTKKLPDSNWDNEKNLDSYPSIFKVLIFSLQSQNEKNAQLFTAQLWIISYIIHFIADFGLYLKKEFIKSLNRKVVCIEEHFTGERIQKTKKNTKWTKLRYIESELYILLFIFYRSVIWVININAHLPKTVCAKMRTQCLKNSRENKAEQSITTSWKFFFGLSFNLICTQDWVRLSPCYGRRQRKR